MPDLLIAAGSRAESQLPVLGLREAPRAFTFPINAFGCIVVGSLERRYRSTPAADYS